MKMLRITVAGLALCGIIFGGGGCTSRPVRVTPPVATSPKVVVPLPPPRPVAAPEIPAQGPVENTARSVVPAPAIEHVAKRLSVYEGRLYRWGAVTGQVMAGDGALPDSWQDCRQLIEIVYQGYGQLRERLSKGEAVEAGSDIDPWIITGQDFDYEASGCEALLAAKVEAMSASHGGEAAAAGEDVVAGDEQRLAEKVSNDVAQGRYRDALAAYRGYASVPAPVGLALGQAYGEALLHTDQVDAALAQFQKLLASPDAGVVMWQLRKRVADLLLAAGRYGEAGRQYQDLAAFFAGLDRDREGVQGQLALLAEGGAHAEELQVYAAALRSYLTFDGKRVPGELKMWVARLEYAHPESDYTHRARQLLDQAEKEARAWISDRLLAVDGLVDAGQYRKALAKLDDLSKQDLPKEMLEVVQKAMDDVVLIEARQKEELRQKTEMMVEERWQEALHLFDSERYDEAIMVFSALFGTGYDVQARVKIGEAAAKAAATLRRQAAAAFLKARQTADPARKREALLESQRLLQSILDKYPFVELVDKVTANMAVINEQLLAIAPVGEATENGGGAGADPSGGGANAGEEVFPW